MEIHRIVLKRFMEEVYWIFGNCWKIVICLTIFATYLYGHSRIFWQNNQNSFMKNTKFMETQEIYGKHQVHGKLWKFHGNLQKKFMENERYLKNLMEIHVFFYKSMDGNSWKCTDLHGNLKKLMEIDGNSWKVMRSLWKLMDIHGNFNVNMETQRNLWKLMEILKKIMEIHGHLKKFMEIHGNLKKVMEVDGNSWKLTEIY